MVARIKKKRTMINADDSLRPVFNGKSQVSMFEMTKLVSKHGVLDAALTFNIALHELRREAFDARRADPGPVVSLAGVPITDSPVYPSCLALLCRRQHCKICRTHFNRRSARDRAHRRNRATDF